MKLLKTTVGLFLLVQVLHLALLQDSTESPGRIIDKGWLRDHHKTPAEGENAASTEGESEFDQEAFTTMSSNDDIDGTASGFMLGNTDVENMLGRDSSENETSDDLDIFTVTLPPVVENSTTKQPELPEATISPTTTTTDSTNSSQTNMTEAEEEFNSTMTTENTTSLPHFSNKTEIRLTTLVPENNTTEPTTPDADKGLKNQTGSSDTTTVTTTAAPPINKTSTTSSSTTDADKGLTNRTGSSDTTTVTTTAAPPINETSTTSSSTTVQPSEIVETSTMTTTTAVPNTAERANKTGKGASSSERGLESDTQRSKRTVTWMALLGTGLVVASVGLVVYIWKKKQNGFTHRKLVEEYPSDPVLRLDNSEPLDLNFGGSAYYNPGLQGDSIQMTNFP
ncbi:uncharacterized protein PAE49_006590 [Odontesthes bonariensis]|uniref:uncharacterized protein LOC142380582 n=1 Tax=Odontesthes bonariensis TaxID=219752 RepID=UPI003F58AD67